MSAENTADDRGSAGKSAEADPAVTLHLAAAVVVDRDRVLVVRRSSAERFLPNVWGVPAGKLDSGETGPEAALRELREETGLAGSVVRYLGHSTFSSVWRGKQAENIQFNFLVEPVGSELKIKLPKEDQAVAWLSRDDVEQFDGLDAYNRDVIGQWLSLPVVGPQPMSATSRATASSSRR